MWPNPAISDLAFLVASKIEAGKLEALQYKFDWVAHSDSQGR